VWCTKKIEMIDDKNLITLKEKLKSLESEIPDLLEKVKMARLDGDLSENAD
jgi:transcription elongation GreA/GreB family factor